MKNNPASTFMTHSGIILTMLTVIQVYSDIGVLSINNYLM